MRASSTRKGLELVNRAFDQQDPRLRPIGRLRASGYVPLETVTGWLAEHDLGFRAALGTRGRHVEPVDRRRRSRPEETGAGAAGQVQEDVLGKFDPCEPGILPSTIAVADLATWRRRLCRINFGRNAVLGIELAADVPATFEPWMTETTADDALSVLLPDWFRRYVAVKASARLALPAFSSNWPRNKGLFWTGDLGFGESAVRMAARTVIAYGDHVGADREAAIACFGDLGRSYGWPALLRDLLASYDIRLRTDVESCVNAPAMVLSLNKASELSYLRPDEHPPDDDDNFLLSTDARRRRLHICALWQFDAGIADYYFYWAHRLWAYARLPGAGTPWHAFLAVLSAKLALTQIVEISGKLVHEMGHFTGIQHCEGGRCCQFVVDQLFMALLRAEIGLPMPLLPGGSTTAADVAPYPDSRLTRDLRSGYNQTATSSCDLPFTEAPFDFTAVHCAALAPRLVFANWSINAICGAPALGTRALVADPSGRGLTC